MAHSKPSAATVEATRRIELRNGGPVGVTVRMTGGFHAGGCTACVKPELGGVVVMVEVGAVRFHLCPDHYAIVVAALDRVAPVRDI